MRDIGESIRQYGVAKLAGDLGVSPQAAHKWISKQIPAERVLQVERITGIPRHELRPDIYPPEPRRNGKRAA